jgi:hypothetical protein
VRLSDWPAGSRVCNDIFPIPLMPVVQVQPHLCRGTRQRFAGRARVVSRSNEVRSSLDWLAARAYTFSCTVMGVGVYSTALCFK